jgi:hypothetical protein
MATGWAAKDHARRVIADYLCSMEYGAPGAARTSLKSSAAGGALRGTETRPTYSGGPL